MKNGAPLSAERVINDAYVAGFWEGDGSCYSANTIIRKKYHTSIFEFSFYQKYSDILDRIQAYLGKGSVVKTKDIWTLKVSDGPQRQELLQRLRKHFCVLGSFAKVTKYRHKFDLTAGGFNPPYPDCTPDFIHTFEKAMNEAILSPDQTPIKISTPLMFLTKAESVLLAESTPSARELLAYSHTCYNGAIPPCDKCHACLLRAKGFSEAGVPDPLVVRLMVEGKLPANVPPAA